MRADEWKRVDVLFHAALDRPPTDRSAYVHAQSLGDESLRREVESLLAAHEQAEGFLEGGAEAPLEEGLETDANPADVRPGGRLGAFEILDADRRGRDGACLSRPRYAARSLRRDQSAVVGDRGRPAQPGALRSRSPGRVQAGAPAHLHAVRPGARAGRGRRDAIPGHGAARRRDARGAARARCAADRTDHPHRLPNRRARYRPRTQAASSIGTSSPPTSC